MHTTLDEDYDVETGLLSRDGLTARIRDKLERESHAVLACLVVRLHVDAGELGHIVHSAAAALTAATRLSDLVARLTTTDFAVVGCDTDAIGARRLAERIASAMREVFEKTGRRGRVRLVVGYEMVSTLSNAVGAETLLLRAAAAARTGVPDSDGRWIRRYDSSTEPLRDRREGGAACAPEALAVYSQRSDVTAARTPHGPGMRREE